MASEALAAGAAQADALRHPERAAAWLRARVLRALQHGVSRDESMPAPERQRALARLGVDAAAYEGLAALSPTGRAAVVASAIERFESIDIETILGATPTAARRVLAQARARYLEAVGGRPAGQPSAASASTEGLLAKTVREVAQRAMTPKWHPQ